MTYRSLIAAGALALLARPVHARAKAAADAPACAVAMVPSSMALRVKVAGRPLALDPVDDQPPQELRVYPGGPGAVLVAYAGRNEHGPYGSSTLWRVACAAGEAETVAHVAGADFGHAALSADRRSLYFTGPDGVFAFDLASHETHRLTTAARDQCRENHVETRDVIAGPVEGGALPFERGCGYGHEWNAVAMVLRGPGTPKMLAARAPQPMASAVAIGAGGWIWLAAGRCGDKAALGRVLVSSDSGKRWRSVEVKMPSPQPARYVIADRARPGAALVLTQSCGSSAHTEPAWIYVTDDGGKTFRPIAVPGGIPSAAAGGPADEQDPIQAVTAPDGTLSRLVLYGESSEVVGALVARWESRDEGRIWKALPPVTAAPALAGNEAAAPPADGGGATIRKDGVYRWQKKGEAGVRIYPGE